jgi:hypothetical protein
VVNLTGGLRWRAYFHHLGDDVRKHVNLLAAVDFACRKGREGGREGRLR